jgi:hypothetical protein
MKRPSPSPTAIAASVIVAGLLIAGTVVGWGELLQGFRLSIFKSPTIDVQALNRFLGEEPVFAGEKLRFSLGNVETDRVYWLIDEKYGTAGSVQTEYSFPYDSLAAGGSVSLRRVDVFYKVGDEYRTASKRVKVNNANINFVAHINNNHLQLTALSELGGGWRLTGASVSHYADGAFSDVATFSPIQQANGQYVALNYSLGNTEPALLSSNDAWISLRYARGVPNQTLTTVQPLRALHR